MARAEIFEQVTSTRGVPLEGIAVTVRKRSDNTVATLYAAATGGTTVANPVSSDAHGQINAWADEGSYVLQATDAADIPFDAVNGDKRIAHAADHASGGSDPVTIAESQVTSLVADLAAKAPLASPTFTGNPLAPTASPGDNDTSIATTAFVTDAVASEATARSSADALKAPLASPTLTGDPKAPTPAPGDNDTSIATSAFVTDAVATEATARSTADAAKAQGLIATAVKTANYAAAAADFVPVDCSSGSVTITLPTAPADRTRIGVKLIAVSGTNTATVARGGTDIFNKAGGSTSLSLTLANQSVLLQYDSGGGIWYVQSTDVPIAGLDLRYSQLTLYDAKGDLLVGTADNTVARKAAGSNYKVLHADSAQSDGLAWDKISDMVKVGATLDRIYPSDLGEYLDRRRSSEIATMSRVFAGASLTVATGTVIGALCYVRTAGTYTQIRFCTGTTVTGATDVRGGVYASDGSSKTTETAESHGTVTTANTVYTLNLGASVVVAEGDALVLAVGFVGTTFTVRGIGGTSQANVLTPQLSRSASGYTTTSVLPASLGSSSGNLPWIELV